MTVLTGKPSVALVDDALEVLEMVSSYLKSKGFQVSCFSDAESAIAESLKPESSWDVLLTDIQLPGMSGPELVVEMKKQFPNMPIILLTTPMADGQAVDAVRSGAYDFIVKPIHFPQLLISIERALHLRELKGDISELRQRVKSSGTSQGSIIGRSPKLLLALDLAKRVAKSTSNILITGESGTGKEIFAKYIHSESPRKKGPFVAINCSAIPENLLESELFGHAKGSFTGAHEKKIGLFEEAQEGTLFLDEIGDLSLGLQAKLLRVLQEKKIMRVGENQYRPVNCRIISATHKDLAVEVRDKRFREDLFYRLDVIPITIPPLRDRPEDVIPLAESFLRRFALENGSPAKVFSKEAVKFLLENPWRGNVRELENTVERAVVLCDKPEISLSDFIPLSPTLICKIENHAELDGDTFFLRCEDRLPELDEVIHKYIEFAVSKRNGALDKTAKEIGIDRKTLYKRLKADRPMLQ